MTVRERYVIRNMYDSRTTVDVHAKHRAMIPSTTHRYYATTVVIPNGYAIILGVSDSLESSMSMSPISRVMQRPQLVQVCSRSNFSRVMCILCTGQTGFSSASLTDGTDRTVMMYYAHSFDCPTVVDCSCKARRHQKMKCCQQRTSMDECCLPDLQPGLNANLTCIIRKCGWIKALLTSFKL